MSRLPFVPCAILLGLLPVAARATTVLPMADDALVDHADVVVRAEVVANAVVRDEAGRIVTDTELRVVETVAGGERQRLTVRALGGVLPDGEGLLVWGAPRFALRDEVLVFLAADAGGRHRVLGFNQGVFAEVAGAFVRVYDGAHELVLPGREEAVAQAHRGRDRSLFLDWVRDRRDGDERAADYFVDRPAASDRIVEKFTLLLDGFDSESVARWIEFDRGEPVVWRRHVAGQTGLPGRGEREVRAAMAAWNDEPHTPVRLVDGGTTTSATGFGGRPRQSYPADGNTILFGDLSDDMNRCTGRNAGPLGIGGARILRDGGTWRGRPVAAIVEAEVVLNADLERCMGSGFSSERMTRLLAHELGHGIGLGHPCGDERSGPCVNARQTAAVMRGGGVVGPDGRLELGTDDVQGLRYLYDASFREADICDDNNGAGNFCNVCAPCSHGEGDCDRDSDCSTVHRGFCAENAGPEFGLGAGVDVCKQGFVCNNLSGSEDHCDVCGPCETGIGDCDRDSDCLPGLVCADDLGPFFGYDPGIDVCIPARGTTGADCPLPFGHPDFCDVCGDPCFMGEGDCDADTDCEFGLVCGSDLGDRFGFKPAIDVCVLTTDDGGGGDDGGDDGGGGECSLPPGDGNYCRECAPCAAGEGDCDRDSDCAAGLACVQDIGAQFGFRPGIDVCR